MARLLALGLLAALFFSSTFVLNRAMSLGGGHWVWSAALRYFWMVPLLLLVMTLTGRGRQVRAARVLFTRHWRFWLLAGTVAFGIFYSGITFAASHAPGWVVATTWQSIIVLSPLVLLAYGRRVPLRGLLFTLIIFAGVIVVNLAQAGAADWHAVLAGALPVVIAAVAYAAGLQLVWEARRGENSRIPHLTDPVLDDGFARVLLLTLGSLPFWVIVILLTRPPAPMPGQWINTLIVAVTSGIIATALYISARQLAQTPYELAGVDATTAAEVVFALIGEVLLLGGAWPGPVAVAGIGLTLGGLVLYLLAQGRSTG